MVEFRVKVLAIVSKARRYRFVWVYEPDRRWWRPMMSRCLVHLYAKSVTVADGKLLGYCTGSFDMGKPVT